MKENRMSDELCPCEQAAYELECKKFGRKSLLEEINRQFEDVKHLTGFLPKRWKDEDDEEAPTNRQALLISLNESLAELKRYISYLPINWKEDNV